MNGVDLLRLQLRSSCDLVGSAALASEDVWTSRAFPGASLPGFVLWHCARIVDWGVQAVVRDAVELADSTKWRGRMRYDLGHGAGLTDEQADEVARTVAAADVAGYATELAAAVADWLDAVAPDDLDRAVDVRAAGRRHPLYATPAASEEVESLDGLPAWQLLSRPCIAHVRVHLGEVQTLAAVARAGLSAGT